MSYNRNIYYNVGFRECFGSEIYLRNNNTFCFISNIIVKLKDGQIFPTLDSISRIFYDKY